MAGESNGVVTRLCRTAALVILLACSAFAQVGTAQSIPPKPSSRIDLKPFGYFDPEKQSREWDWDETGYIAFLDSDTIVVAFSESTRRYGIRPAKFVLIRAQDGKVIRELDWQATDGLRLFRGPDDKFLIRSGSKLTQYSRSLEPLRTRDIGHTHVAVSPSGRTLLTFDWGRSRISCENIVLNSENLEERARWKVPASCPIYIAVSDEAVAFLREDSHEKWTLLIREFQQAPRILNTTKGEWCHPKPLFASNSVLVLNQPRNWFGCLEFLVVDSNGTALHRQPLEKYEHFDNERDADLSRDGSLMAVVVTERKVGFLLKLLAEDGMAKNSRQRLLVYDIAHGRKLWDMVLKPFPKQSARVAVSPDGSRLALLRDGWVEIYPTAGESNPSEVR